MSIRQRDGDPSHDERRESFGAWAEAYDRYRPGYPAEAVRWLLAPVSPDGGPVRVADVGAGTGLLTAVVTGLGHDAVAVEPDDRMRSVLADRLGAGRALAGRAEELPLPDGSCDAVLLAQAWHWVDPVVAVPEVARVLRPGGVLGVLWNLRDDRVPWVAELTARLGLEDAYGGFRDEEGLTLDATWFGPAEPAEFANPVRSDPDHLAGTMSTYSLVRLRPDAEAAVATARALAAREAAADGSLVMPYVTRCYRAVRT